uniref:zinc finger protein ush isoform X3 n=1 Tax=Anopheles coluzzii TaxID=1518534 RepID=UPI0020FFE18A|nr:zinc finger protein ush isoform X3 [Anopheles coluzzii]
MIMSRRKQSNPKPLLQKRDDEEAGGDEQSQQQQQTQSTAEENGDSNSTIGSNSANSSSSSSSNSSGSNHSSRSNSRAEMNGGGTEGGGSAQDTKPPCHETEMGAGERGSASPHRTATDERCETPADETMPLREIKQEPNAEQEAARHDHRPASSSSSSHGAPHTPSPTPMPMLRLNVALAADPAANPDAKDLKNLSDAEAALEEKQSQQLHQQQHALNMAIGGPPPPPALQQLASSTPPALLTRKPKELALPVELPPRLPMFICGPCGIRFSSASTLEAHQTYYCSHRKDADEGGGGGGGAGAGGTGNSGANATVTGGPSSGGVKNAHPGGEGGEQPPAKALKTGKQYACSQCSYSADKKVSLNRHMRMHQSSPSPSPVGAIVNGDEAIVLANHHQQQQQHQQQQLQLIQAQAVAAAAAVLHQQQQQQQGQQPPQGPAPQVDRYCSDCDIRFSSTKTYRAHKQHYCSSRHREGNQSNNSTPKPASAPKSGSQSPPDVPKTPPVGSAAAAAASSQQPFLALPTNPIIVIPYSLIRGASVIPGLLSSLAPGVANPESACFILQNGSLQPIAMSLASQVQAVTAAIVPSGFEGLIGSPGGPATTRPGISSGNQQQTHQQPAQPPSRGPTPNISNSSDNNSVHSGSGGGGPASGTGEVLKAINKRENSANRDAPTGSTPLDLSVRRLSPGAIGSLSLRERSLSLSSAVSADPRLDFDSLMEGKENLSVSGDSLTPEQIVCAPSLPGSPPLTPSPKRRSNSPRGGGGGGGGVPPPVSNATTAAAVAAAAHAAAAVGQHGLGGPVGGLSLSPLTLQQQLMRPLLPADIALRLSAVGDPGVNLNLNILPNTHPLLTKQSVELALRLSSSAGVPVGDGGLAKPQISPLLNSISPTGSVGGGGPAAAVLAAAAQTPQIFVKQGDSKCKECNIVFCKYENYLAHKKHYCSARNQDGGGDGELPKVSPPISPQAMGGGGGGGGAGGGGVSSGGSPAIGVGAVAYQQLICAACGIKFTSLDNLSAHQMYYCPKRIDATLPVSATTTTVVTAQPHKERCSKCKSLHEPGQPCTVAGHGAYKCPICEVISPNSTEARRHMDTHGGVKAFRCTICRYKGNTLRGMRTHIRMHFDKKTSEFNEENFITCILEEDGIEIPPAGAQNAAAMAAAAAAAAAHALASQKSFAPPPPSEADGVARISPPTAGNGQSVRHHCEFCPYSSSYRVNVAKHIKHVHGRDGPSPGSSPLIGEGGESLLYNGTGPVAGDSGSVIARPPIAVTPGLTMANSQVIKTEPKDEAGHAPSPDAPDALDINVDIVLEEPPAIKSEVFDPHMPSLNSPLTSPVTPSPPAAAAAPAAAPSTTVKQKSHPTNAASSPGGRTEHGIKTPSPPVEVSAGGSPQLPPGPKYCDTCDITFNYTNTYIAHKKFYCKAAVAAAAAAAAAAAGTASASAGSGVGRRSASASPSRAASTSPAVTVAVNRATETSV